MPGSVIPPAGRTDTWAQCRRASSMSSGQEEVGSPKQTTKGHWPLRASLPSRDSTSKLGARMHPAWSTSPGPGGLWRSSLRTQGRSRASGCRYGLRKSWQLLSLFQLWLASFDNLRSPPTRRHRPSVAKSLLAGKQRLPKRGGAPIFPAARPTVDLSSVGAALCGRPVCRKPGPDTQSVSQKEGGARVFEGNRYNSGEVVGR